ncbi:uncharacterized protein K02A2.6-like [Topomyia yanbarensis]|uniref:uncharacterized protein K02A2.6-like n=1 Tax=Topomyia yanbarensis TaxID=2498891 RepID=UPI00273B5FD7|nr:uncharacterized protein K02A2.6-like [Topomyia yanbarensis]
MLHHYMGADSYNLLCDHVSPAEPETKTYAEIVTVLGEHYGPQPLEMVELFKFSQRTEREGLRNQLVFGLRSQRIRARLIEERDLTYDKAKQSALSMEASGDGADVLNRRMQDVNLVDKGKFPIRQESTTDFATKNDLCFRCGSERHLANKCEHRDKICSLCKKKGHLKRVCLSSKPNYSQSNANKYKPKKHSTNLVEGGGASQSDCSDEDEIHLIDICKLEHNSKDLSKINLKVRVGGSPIKFEVDSGSPVSLISNAGRLKFLTNLPLRPTDIELRSYCGNKIRVYGIVDAEVAYNGQSNQLCLFVVDTKRHPLLGREWMRALQLDWNDIMCFDSVDRISLCNPLPQAVRGLMEEFPAVFEESIARTLPFSIRDTVEREILSMEENGILVKVNPSEWATPVVPVMKSANKVRLCGVFMARGKKFTKLDLAQAYLQMQVRPENQALLTLNTHLGLYQPTRLMYGVASAPAIFQREISQILQGIPGVSVFWKTLREVLKRFQEHNMRVNLTKCEFFADSIQYCGYAIDSQGIHKMLQKVEAIQKMPRPENREQARAFLGLVNYYGRF